MDTGGMYGKKKEAYRAETANVKNKWIHNEKNLREKLVRERYVESNVKTCTTRKCMTKKIYALRECITRNLR